VEFEKKNLIGGIFLYNWGQLGANVLVEFKNVFRFGGIFSLIGGKWGQMCKWNFKKILIGGIFSYNWGQLGANVLVEFKNVFLLGAFFSIIGGNRGQLGANMFVEFENIVLIGGIFFTIGGIFFSFLGAKNNFGIEKTSYFGNYMDPCIFVVLN